MKTKIKKLLDSYGCLQIHKGEPINDIYNQLRDEDLVNDLFNSFSIFSIKFNPKIYIFIGSEDAALSDIS